MNVEDFIYESYGKVRPYLQNQTDDIVRKPHFAKQILDEIGIVEEPIPAILVTGSKGKGSVSRMIAFLLEKAGYRVGHYSSPHLLDFAERIRVNGKAISDEDLERLAKAIKPMVERIEVEPKSGEYISPIAISQAIAMLYFKEQQVDVAIIEAGRGGRFDDTNQIPHQVAVITALFEEHLPQLGPTIREVIWHKLGVVTADVKRVYIGRQMDGLQDLITKQLEEDGVTAPVYRYGSDFMAHHVALSIDGTFAEIYSHHAKVASVTIPLLGQFQADNFALAYTVANDFSNWAVSRIDWSIHLPMLRWPGRCEVIGRTPLVILDGGVHRSSAWQVRELITQIPYSSLHVVLSIPADKDIEGVLQVWSDLADRIITTTTTNPYLHYHENSSAVLRKHFENGQHCPDVRQAVDLAMQNLANDGVLLLMGTQSFVADIKRIWGESVRDL